MEVANKGAIVLPSHLFWELHMCSTDLLAMGKDVHKVTRKQSFQLSWKLEFSLTALERMLVKLATM